MINDLEFVMNIKYDAQESIIAYMEVDDSRVLKSTLAAAISDVFQLIEIAIERKLPRVDRQVL